MEEEEEEEEEGLAVVAAAHSSRTRAHSTNSAPVDVVEVVVMVVDAVTTLS